MSTDIARRDLLQSRRDAVAALDHLIGAAQSSVQIFDQDLATTGYDSAVRSELLRAFLLGGRQRRLHIALHRTHLLEAECPRVLSVLRDFSTRSEVRRTMTGVRHAADNLVIVDGMHYWRQLQFDQSRYVVVADDPVATKEMTTRFQEIWEQTTTVALTKVLGL